MGTKYNHLSYVDRIKIEALYKEKHTPKEISRSLGFSLATIYNELKRGRCTLVDALWREYTSYSAYIAQEKYLYNLQGKGGELKIGNDYEFVDYIEHKIINEKYSPDALIGELRVKGNPFKSNICTKTLYNYIDIGIFPNLTNSHLLIKTSRKRTYKKLLKSPMLNRKGTSIEKRSKDIEARQDFGHWEMDCIVGKSTGKSTSLLVLSERKTRQEIIIKLQQKNMINVVKSIDLLERKYKRLFPKIFKTITVDNGVEFMDFNGIEKSCIYKNRKRTQLYYCHPFSSWERGTNENTNKMIRRFIPKGSSLRNISPNHLKYIETYINNYPRKILGYYSSDYLFNKELELLINC